jgi:AraC-like DNA-binding protein
MSRIETLSTENVAAHRKVRFWNDTVSATVASATADPLDARTFSGTLKRLDLGAMRFAEIIGGASHVRRSPSPARASHFVLSVMLAGEIVCRTEGSDTRLRTGDFWLFDSAAGAKLFLAQPASLLAIVVRREHIARYMACPEALTSLVVAGESGAGALASRYLRDFWARAEHELTAELAARFAEVGLQMVAGAYAAMPDARPERSCLLTQHRMRIRAYIEQHLRDPDLTLQSIADDLRITRSYVHRLFSGDSESIARFILRRRLEEAHRVLTDCIQAGHSVTRIAFEHGFNSLPHFCRAFRAHYGITPREAQLQVTTPRTCDSTAPCSRAPHLPTASAASPRRSAGGSGGRARNRSRQ